MMSSRISHSFSQAFEPVASHSNDSSWYQEALLVHCQHCLRVLLSGKKQTPDFSSGRGHRRWWHIHSQNHAAFESLLFVPWSYSAYLRSLSTGGREALLTKGKKKSPQSGIKNQIAGMFHYAVMISLYFPDTQPTWLPITTACQPFWAVAIHSHSVPSGTAVMRA